MNANIEIMMKHKKHEDQKNAKILHNGKITSYRVVRDGNDRVSLRNLNLQLVYLSDILSSYKVHMKR